MASSSTSTAVWTEKYRPTRLVDIKGHRRIKQLFERVQKQAFAEPARAAQKVVLAAVHQIDRQAGFVHVVMPVFADFAQVLYANGQLLAMAWAAEGIRHRAILAWPPIFPFTTHAPPA